MAMQPVKTRNSKFEAWFLQRVRVFTPERQALCRRKAALATPYGSSL